MSIIDDIFEREIAAANAKADRDDERMAAAARGEPFFTNVATGPITGLSDHLPTAHDAEADALADRVATLEHELAKADRRTAEQERVIAMRGELIGKLRDGLIDALAMYDEAPGGPEWSGCFCPSSHHTGECHLKRVAVLRKLTEAP